MSWLNYQQTKNSLSKIAADNLQQSARLSVTHISNWFKDIYLDVNSQAELQENIALLNSLENGYVQSGESLTDYIKSDDWQQRIDKLPNGLAAMNHRYDYIYDLFLIDAHGNILYTVERESDLGTNLLKGIFSQTGLANVVKKTLETGQTAFSGMERYFPSNQAIAGFISAPILDKSENNVIGVLAMQLRLDTLFTLFESSKETSLHHYLIGEDGYLRTPLRNNNWLEVLTRDVNTEQLQKYRSKNDWVPDIAEYTGPEGVDVIGQYQKVQIGDVNWILVSEINAKEALFVASRSGRVAVTFMIVTVLIVIMVAAVQSRLITRPITELARLTNLIIQGDTTSKVEVSSNDEIGVLASSFNEMLDIRREYTAALEKSEGEAKRALAKVAEQQYALDQHAIVAITDLDGTIIFANEMFSDISGYSQKELIGQNHRLLNSGTHDKQFFKEMFAVISSGKVWHGEICNRAKDGYLYWVDSTILPFMGDDGTPRSYIAIRTDITDKKRHEAQLLEALAELNEKQLLLEEEEKIAKHVFENITASSNDTMPELATWCEPMGSFSGDLILSSLLPDGSLRVILCDFTGHGLPAALGAVPVSSIYAAITAKGLPLDVLMDELNEKLKSLLPVGIFCCVAGVDVNADRNYAQVWNSGLPDVLLVDAKGGIKERYRSNHLPLGVMSYEREEMHMYGLTLEAGDTIYVYSDGLIEAENSSRDMYGQDRFDQLFDSETDQGGRLEEIKTSVRVFAEGAAATDDISLIEIKTLVT